MDVIVSVRLHSGGKGEDGKKEDDHPQNLHMIIAMFSPEQVQKALMVKRQSQWIVFYFFKDKVLNHLGMQ